MGDSTTPLGFFIAAAPEAYAFRLHGETEVIWIPKSQIGMLVEAPRYEWTGLDNAESWAKDAMKFLEGRQEVALMDLARHLGIAADRGRTARILAYLGWRPRRVRDGGIDRRIWRYVPTLERGWEAPRFVLSGSGKGRGNKERAFVDELWRTGLVKSSIPESESSGYPKNRSPLFPPCGFGRPRGCRCPSCEADRAMNRARSAKVRVL